MAPDPPPDVADEAVEVLDAALFALFDVLVLEL
jgi:hypothetical protein